MQTIQHFKEKNEKDFHKYKKINNLHLNLYYVYGIIMKYKIKNHIGGIK